MCAPLKVRTGFFRRALIVLGTVPEVRRCGTGTSEKILGAEVQVRTICVSRCGGAVPDYPISSNAPSSAFGALEAVAPQPAMPQQNPRRRTRRSCIAVLHRRSCGATVCTAPSKPKKWKLHHSQLQRNGGDIHHWEPKNEDKLDYKLSTYFCSAIHYTRKMV